ncbi:MAG: transposase family protein [Bacteriovoracaceae bacterium]|nr:transposase family protein [Bacteriovoracaceae bacterium]
MKYKTVSELKEEQFRKLTGVKRQSFDKMVEILEENHTIKKSKGGRKNTLCREDMLLMTLEYLREYRTYFHIRLLSKLEF